MNRPAYSLCLCPDSKLLRDRIDTLAATHPPPESGMTAPAGGRQRFLFWGDEGIPPAFWEHLTLQGLFASPKILIIRNAQNLNADKKRVGSRLKSVHHDVYTHAPIHRDLPACYRRAESLGEYLGIFDHPDVFAHLIGNEATHDARTRRSAQRDGAEALGGRKSLDAVDLHETIHRHT